LRQVRFVPGSQTMVVAGGALEPGHQDGNLRLVDVRDGRLCGEIVTGLAVAYSLSLSHDGGWLSVVGQTKERKAVVQVWDLTARRRVHEFPEEGAAAGQLFAAGTKLLVLIGGADDPEQGSLVTYDLLSGHRFQRILFIEMAPRFAVFSRDEK